MYYDQMYNILSLSCRKNFILQQWSKDLHTYTHALPTKPFPHWKDFP